MPRELTDEEAWGAPQGAQELTDEQAWGDVPWARSGHGLNLAAGLTEGIPQMAGGLVDLSRSLPDSVADFGQGGDPYSNAPAEPSRPWAPGSAAERWADSWLEAAGLEDVEPATAGQRRTRSVGRGVAQALPTLAIPGAGALRAGQGVTRAIARELIAGAAGELAATEVATQTDNPWAIGAAGVLGGVTPGTGAMIGRGMADTIATRAPRMASREGSRAAAKAHIMARVRDMYGDNDEILEAAAKYLESPDADDLTVAQALGNAPPESGIRNPNIAGQEEFVARRHPRLQGEIAGQRVANEAATAGQLADVMPQSGRPRVAQGLAASTERDLRQSVTRGFREAGKDGTYDIAAPARDVKRRATRKALDLSRRNFPEDINPKVRDLVDNMPARSSIGELENLREVVNKELDRVADMPGKARSVEYLMEVKSSIDSTMTKVAGRTKYASSRVAKLRARIADRAELGELYERGPLKAFLEAEDPNKALSLLLQHNKSRTPVRNLRMLRRALRNDPDGWASVQDLMAERIIGDASEALIDPAKTAGIKGALKRLTKEQAAFDEVFGQGASVRARTLLKKLEKQKTGRVGKSDLSVGPPGSAQQTSEMQRTAVDVLENRGGLVSRALDLARVTPTDSNVLDLWAELFSNKKMMADVFRGAKAEHLAEQIQSMGRYTRIGTIVGPSGDVVIGSDIPE